MSVALRSFAAGIAFSLLAPACVQQNDDPNPIASALPRAEDVKIKLPEGREAARAVGQIAPYYVITRTVTRDLNGATGHVLLLVHAIVQLPATTIEGDTYTWGPSQDALDPASYKLTVVDRHNGSYDWKLEGRNKSEPASLFEAVLTGVATPSDPIGTGHGHFTFDFDAAERVNPIDNDGRGVLDVTYDLDERTVDIHAATAEDRGGVLTPVAYDYAYAAAADGSGNMTFNTHGDTEDAGTRPEDVTLRSRWKSDGPGRTDARVENGDLGSFRVTASECWDANFRRVYYTDSANSLPTEGDVSACAFADQDLPQ